jgi:ABC-type multidrug transport system ATPase subunit
MSIPVENLVKRFGGAAVLSELSFSAEAGEFFVVLGPSGCGKSTLLRLIAGLEESDGGRTALDGRDVSAPGLHVPPEAGTGGSLAGEEVVEMLARLDLDWALLACSAVTEGPRAWIPTST